MHAAQKSVARCGGSGECTDKKALRMSLQASPFEARPAERALRSEGEADVLTWRRLVLLIAVLGSIAGCATRTELDWHQEDEYRWAAVDPEFWGNVDFTKRASSHTSIRFENRLTEAEVNKNQHYMNGSGVAAGDVNGDGWTDLYFARLHGPNRLYENLGGFEFKDVTGSAGVARKGAYSTGTNLADIDGDEDLDLLVGSTHVDGDHSCRPVDVTPPPLPSPPLPFSPLPVCPGLQDHQRYFRPGPDLTHE